MRPPGTYKIRYQRCPDHRSALLHACGADDPIESALAREASSERRMRRIVDSLRDEILEGGEAMLRVRRIFSTPREIYRLEIERPELGYQRTTLLDRDALECLLEADEVRSAFELALSA